MENIEKIQELLSKNGIKMDDEKLKTTVVEMQFLVEIWLDDLEKQIFDGKTLNELISNTDI
ncbi:hypothetical protein ABWL48_20615 [Streptococcus suis]|jgi:ribosomal protein L12E/L44/L45/RPP1/RPP2